MAAILAVFALIPSWAYKWIGVALALVAAYLYVDTRAANREHAKCEAAAQEALRQAGVQDDTAARKALAEEQRTTSDLRGQKEKDDAELSTLRSELAKRPETARCIFTKPDIDWLRE